MRGSRRYSFRGPGRLLLLGHQTPGMSGTRTRGHCRMGGRTFIPGMRGSSLFPARSCHNNNRPGHNAINQKILRTKLFFLKLKQFLKRNEPFPGHFLGRCSTKHFPLFILHKLLDRLLNGSLFCSKKLPTKCIRDLDLSLITFEMSCIFWGSLDILENCHEPKIKLSNCVKLV